MDFSVFVPIAFFAMIAYIVKVMAQTRVHKIMAEKGGVKGLMRPSPAGADPAFTSLKWGLILVGAGMAVLLGQLVPSESRGAATWGLVFLFVGAALLISYRIEMERSQQEQAPTGAAASKNALEPPEEERGA